MSRYIQGEHKDQVSLLPMTLNEMIAEDHPVRVIDAFVDTLDMQRLGFRYGVTKEVGRQPFDPRHLLKLFLYGYLNGIRTTRKLEREAHRNIEVMWLLDQLKPDDRTISNFRQHNPEALKNIFKEFSLLCNELGLYGKQIIAVDGSKFRASNSRQKSFTKRKVPKMLKHYEDSASKYLALLEAGDRDEGAAESASTVDLKEKLRQAQARIQELEAMAGRIKETGEISVTDPDARHMSVSNNGTDIAHNVQIAVDEKHHLVAAVDVVSSPADQRQLHNISSQAVESFEAMDADENPKPSKEPITVLADKGYYCGEELEKCKQEQMKLIVSRQKPATQKGQETYSKERFTYDPKTDEYICPMGQRLKSGSHKATKDRRYKNAKACKNCPVHDECTSSKGGRTILRGPHQDLYDEVNWYTQEHMDLYKKRQMIVEHPFGTVKRSFGYSYFLTRGNRNVKAESFMHFFTYNFTRVLNIMDRKELIRYLKAKKHGLSCFLNEIFNFNIKNKLIFEF